MPKKQYPIIVLVFVILLIATACGKDTTSDSKSKAEEGEDVTLEFLRLGDPGKVEPIFDSLLEKFQEENPDIKIKQTNMGFDEAKTKIPLLASTDSLPDVFFTTVNFGYDLASKGKIIPLDSYIDSNSELKNDIFQSLWDAVKFDGDTYWVPAGVAPIHLWYNTEIFKQAGLDPNQPPETFEELLEYAQTITEETGIPGFGMHASVSDDLTTKVASVYQSFSGKPLWDSETETVTIKDNKESMIDTLDYFYDLVKTYGVTQSNIEEHTSFTLRPLFKENELAMILDGIWVKDVINDKLESGEIKTANFPEGPGGSHPVIGTDGWAISSNSEYPEEAWKLIDFLMETENQSHHDVEYGLAPVLESQGSMPEYQTNLMKTIIEAEQDAFGRIANENVTPIETLIAEEAQGVFTDSISSEEATENIIKQIEEILE